MSRCYTVLPGRQRLFTAFTKYGLCAVNDPPQWKESAPFLSPQLRAWAGRCQNTRRRSRTSPIQHSEGGTAIAAGAGGGAVPGLRRTQARPAPQPTRGHRPSRGEGGTRRSARRGHARPCGRGPRSRASRVRGAPPAARYK